MAQMQTIIGVIILACSVTGQDYILGKTGTIGTFLGNGNGRPCFFPFKYLGKMYSYCTDIDHVRPWCSVTEDYDDTRLWGNCIDQVNNGIRSTARSGGMDTCVFPFVYEGVSYDECLPQKNNPYWCSVTPNYDDDELFGECQVYGLKAIQTWRGTGDNKPCAFPFVYGGITRYSCINDDFSLGVWCATTADYDRDRLWGACISETSTVQTRGGNDAGAECVFPFEYEGIDYVGCINNDNRKLWCSTTRNYTADGLWGRCILYPLEITATNGRLCQFPFRFEGVDYWGCITSSGRGTPWCGTERDSDRGWDTCNIVRAADGKVFTVKGNAGGALCVFPFTYNGKTYYDCVSEDDDDPWCATTSDYNTDPEHKWGYCYKYQ